MAELSEKMYQAFHLASEEYADVLAAADDASQRLSDLYPLSDDERLAISDYDAAFLVRFTYNSAAIEGSTLSLMDTALVLEGEFMPSDPADKRLSDIFAARGIADGVAFSQAAREKDACLTEDLIKDIHERTAIDCQPRTRGSYRAHPAMIVGSKTNAAAASQVRSLMGDLLFQIANTEEHPIIAVSAFHAMYEHIHPFTDGNGRTGRIVMNFMLEQSAYPPIALKAANRASYLAALEDWQVRDNPRPLVALVANQVVEEANTRIELILETRGR